MPTGPPSHPTSERTTLSPGDRLGRYQLVQALARGGMGMVWAARLDGQRGFSKLFAVKTTLPQLARDPEFERMFLDEARIASRVHHPNVCQILELGEDANVLYIAMEWVTGDSLHNLLRVSGKCEPLDLRVAARIVSEACAGLHAAHELVDDDGVALHVVHRDVSPQNVLVTVDGNVKVADFGVAKAHGQLHQTSASGAVKGKVSYMAPEQLAGGDIDRRADIFALGCVLYEATTGKRPFARSGEIETMYALVQGSFDRPSKIAADYPLELEAIVLRALSRAPSERFATADEMHVALEEWLARSGPVLSQSQVAAVVRARLGERIDARQKRIRAAFEAIAPPDPDESGSQPSLSRGSAGAALPAAAAVELLKPTLPMPFPPAFGETKATGTVTSASVALRAAPPRLRSRAVWGVLAAVTLVGAAVAVKWHHEILSFVSSANPQATGTSSMASAPSLSVMPPPSSPPSASAPLPVAAPSASSQVALSAAPDDGVVLNIDPAGAIVRIDGKTLAAGHDSVARPRPGQHVELNVQAPGFLTQKVTVDARTPSPLVVHLVPVARNAGGSTSDPLNAPNPFRGQPGGPQPGELPTSNPYRP